MTPADGWTMPHRTTAGGRLSLSVLGFGCAPLGRLFQRIDEGAATAAVTAALDAGIDYFDVAPFYGTGLAEHRLGTALRGRRTEAIVSTKVGRLLRPAGAAGPAPEMFVDRLPFDIVYDYSRDGVLRSVDDSLQRLGTDRLEILYIHDVNARWHGDEVEARYAEAMRGAFPALAELRAAGRVKAIGVGVNDPAMLARFARDGDFDLFMLAGRYTLLDQSGLDELLPLCLRRGIGIVAAGPFNSGILATGASADAKFFYADAPAEIVERTRRIERVCQAHSVPLPVAALQFALIHPGVISVATGMISPGEVAANVAALRVDIPVDLWSDLKSADLLHPDTPVGR